MSVLTAGPCSGAGALHPELLEHLLAQQSFYFRRGLIARRGELSYKNIRNILTPTIEHRPGQKCNTILSEV